jgi:phosphonate transport system substrate-binding protein
MIVAASKPIRYSPAIYGERATLHHHQNPRIHQPQKEDAFMADGQHILKLAPLLSALATMLLASACSGGGEAKVFYIAGIPDQNISILEARFDGLAKYLSDETGIDVEYIPSIAYASVVTAFKQGDVHMAWYGGLTGVQARLAVPDAKAIAQRPRDRRFHSVFVADPSLGLSSLEDVRGKRLTFGSESSTSGHLMPRFFLTEAGIDVAKDLNGPPNYSGSHDKTWKLVESGAFQIGVLNEAVWTSRVAVGDIDTGKVAVFFTTSAFYDYHWVIRGDTDEVYGAGTTQKIQDALLRVRIDAGERERAIAEAFQTDKFIRTTNENYSAIESIARQLGLVE